MKNGIHPAYNQIPVKCNCGHEFEIGSVLNNKLVVDVCSECHPFFTGKQKVVDREARVQHFNNRYGGFSLLGENNA